MRYFVANRFRRTIITLGILLSAASALRGFSPREFGMEVVPLGLLVASLRVVPYAAYWLVSPRIRTKGPVVVSGLLVLAVDIAINIDALFFVSSYTHARLLLLAPLFLTVIVLPIGLIGGWLIELIAGKRVVKSADSDSKRNGATKPDITNPAANKFQLIIVTLGISLLAMSALWGLLSQLGSLEGGFHLLTLLVGMVFFLGWGIIPYIFYWLVSSKIRAKGPIIVSGVLILALDIWVHVDVFFFPTSSTHALLLVFSPLYLTIFVLPVGLLAGWLIGFIAGKLVPRKT